MNNKTFASDTTFTFDTTFTSESIAKTASILLNGSVDKVFPLFGAFEERKWSERWNPTLIYPEKEIIEEGTPSAEITYSFTGLNALGNEINEHFLQLIYRHDLADWAEEINHYLKTQEK